MLWHVAIFGSWYRKDKGKKNRLYSSRKQYSVVSVVQMHIMYGIYCTEWASLRRTNKLHQKLSWECVLFSYGFSCPTKERMNYCCIILLQTHIFAQYVSNVFNQHSDILHKLNKCSSSGNLFCSLI